MYNYQIVRKRGSKLFLFVFLVCMIAFFWFSQTSFAASQSMQELVEAAKREGEVNYYSSMSTAGVTGMISEFQKKYPFMKVNLLRLGSARILTKVLAEYRMNKHSADVLMTYVFSMYTFMKKGVLGHYLSTENSFYPKEFKEQDYWTTTYCNPNITSYNTRFVRQADLPKTYDDLLDPKWKGKMMMDPSKVDWFTGMLQIMGREKGLEFMRKLSRQDIGKRRGQTLIAQLVVAGEADIQINSSITVAERIKKTGAPFDWVALGPVPGVSTGIGITSKPPHPNAARLFVDFILSKETQTVLTKAPLFYNVVRSDVTRPANYEALQLVPVNPSSAENLNEYTELLREIFSG